MVDMFLLIVCGEGNTEGGGTGESGGVGTTRKQAMEAVYCCGVPAASSGHTCVPASSKMWVPTPSSIIDGSSHAN